MIKELSQSELALVAGGNANSNYKGGSSRSNKRNQSYWSHMAQMRLLTYTVV